MPAAHEGYPRRDADPMAGRVCTQIAGHAWPDDAGQANEEQFLKEQEHA
jgi:hypothetical protein